MSTMNVKVIDARGLSCPQPAAMAKQAMTGAGAGAIDVLVDSATARENVARIARLAGWEATVAEEAAGEYRICLRK